MDMRRIAPMLLVAFLVVLLPAAALAQPQEELDALEGTIGNLEGETVDEWTEGSAAVADELEALRAAAADLDYAELDQAVADLDAAIEGGDLEEIAAAAAVLGPAFDALAAQAAAGDGTAEPTAVDTGDAVDGGPNLALLVVSGVLALLAVGAFGLRRAVDRR
jgi:hypothetical protein